MRYIAGERLKVGDRIVRDSNLQAVAARPNGEDRPVYVVVEVIEDAILARPERWEGVRFMPVATERLHVADMVTMSVDGRSVSPWRPLDESPYRGIAIDAIEEGESAIYDVTSGHLSKKL